MILEKNVLWLTHAEAKKFSRLHAVPLATRVSVADYNHAIKVSVDWYMRKNTTQALWSAYELFCTQLSVDDSGTLILDPNPQFLRHANRESAK